MGNITFGRTGSDKSWGCDVEVLSGCAGGSSGFGRIEAGSTGSGAADSVGIFGFSSSTGGPAAIDSSATGVSTLAVERVVMPRLFLARLANFPAFSAACTASEANFCSRRSLSALLSLILFGLPDGGLAAFS